MIFLQWTKSMRSGQTHIEAGERKRRNSLKLFFFFLFPLEGFITLLFPIQKRGKKIEREQKTIFSLCFTCFLNCMRTNESQIWHIYLSRFFLLPSPSLHRIKEIIKICEFTVVLLHPTVLLMLKRFVNYFFMRKLYK